MEDRMENFSREELAAAVETLEEVSRLERQLGVQAAELELYKQKYLAAITALRAVDDATAREIDGWA